MERVRIGHLSTFYHTAVFLMAKGDAPEKLGREIEWRLFGTGPAIVNAMEKGEIDLAYIGLPPAVIGIERGVRIVCVAGGHLDGTVLSGRLRYRGYPDLPDLGGVLGQFSGQKIGVPGRGSIHDVIIRELLERSGLDNDVEVVNFAWADLVLEAVVKDRVSAAVGTPALAVAVRRYADGHILYPPSGLWPNNPSYGILASVDFLERERDLVENFLVLHEEATSILRNSAPEAARLISSYVGFIDEEFVLETLKVSPKYCTMLTDDFIACTMEFVGVLTKLGYIRRRITAEEIFDLSLISKLHPGKDHYGEGLATA